jgi:hypothetical protein
MNTTQAINGEIGTGDWVLITESPPYSNLVGRVVDVVPHDSPEHDTDSGMDDVHISFADAGYFGERKAEILSVINNVLYLNEESLAAFDLGDVVMPPCDLIRITGIAPEKHAELLESNAAGAAYYSEVMQNLSASKEAELMARFDQNLADYHAALESFSPKELIGMADKIAATNRVHAYMTQEHGMEDDELDFLLEFQNPLEVVADAWHGYDTGNEDMAYVVFNVFDKQDALVDYPLMRDSSFDFDEQRRFMGVDLIDFLGKIAGKVIVHYPNDWNIDVDKLYRAAGSDNPEDKRLMWHVSSYGTHMNTERETFIKDTGAFNTWVDYRQNDPDMFGYAVEVTGCKGGVVTGNVFDLGHYLAHTMHVREDALVLEMLSLTYSDNWGVNAGKTIIVPHCEYDSDRHRLMCESGDVTTIEYHPYVGAREMDDVLRCERAARMAYPLGSMETHLARLDAVLAELRTPPELPPTDKKPSIGDKLRAGKEKADANRGQKPADAPKNHRKEIGD